ncbi:MAG: glutamyl-tRNA reductase [Deltaproteobacteria bacterium]|nr:glutamyl-tRNA reductase [Deltaproteobacteria bacterium]
MSLLLAGLSHHTAPVELRECLAVVDKSPESTLERLLKMDQVREGFFVSTCNRVEFLLVTEPGAAETAAARLLDFLTQASGLDNKALKECLYLKQDQEAIQHLFRVASSLDSLVVGEPQVLGQIKTAYRQASQAKTLGVILNRLMHKTFHVAKRVRTETGISDRAVSIAFAAVDLAKKIFGRLEGKKVLLLGAGQMAELAAEHFLAQQVAELTVANRTLKRAMEVAQRFGGRAVGLAELEEELVKADIVLASTAAAEPVLTVRTVKAVLRPRKRRPLFIIDIAVPRDVEKEVSRLENVFVYDIDDLQEVVAKNLAERRHEAVKAERIVEQEAIKFQDWLESLAVVPTIKAVQAKLEQIRCQELDKTLDHLNLSPDQARRLEAMTKAMMKKVLHDPAVFLKRNWKNPDNRTRYLDAVHRLFELNGVGQDDKQRKD